MDHDYQKAVFSNVFPRSVRKLPLHFLTLEFLTPSCQSSLLNQEGKIHFKLIMLTFLIAYLIRASSEKIKFVMFLKILVTVLS